MLENIEQAFQGIWGHKLRSILTMLGIIIGIASIITIVSTIKGTNEQIKENLIGSGNNIVTVSLYQDDYAYDLQYSALPDGVAAMKGDNRDALMDMDSVSDISVYYARNYAEGVFRANTAYSGALYGIDSHYLTIEGYKVTYGRNFISSDYAKFEKVVIIDTVTRTLLFPGENPLGKTIEIQGEPFVVVGIAAQSSDFSPAIETINDYYTYQGSSSGGKIFVPDAIWPMIYRFDEPQSVAIKAVSTDAMTDAGNAAADYLTANLITATDNNFSYRATNLLEQAEQLQTLSNATNKQLIWIASISLLVGGIGVMNIMLVSVTERTSEIGLKKAIGAKRRRILWQFLTEASVLTSIGGVAGVVGGVAMATLISKVIGTPSAISIPSILIAVVFSMVIGIVFGLIPRAQSLQAQSHRGFEARITTRLKAVPSANRVSGSLFLGVYCFFAKGQSPFHTGVPWPVIKRRVKFRAPPCYNTSRMNWNWR